jgi:hypothetical protein
MPSTLNLNCDGIQIVFNQKFMNLDCYRTIDNPIEEKCKRCLDLIKTLDLLKKEQQRILKIFG